MDEVYIPIPASMGPFIKHAMLPMGAESLRELYLMVIT